MFQMESLFICGYDRTRDYIMNDIISIRLNYNDEDLGYFHFDTIDITINPKLIRDNCSEYNADFYTLLMHVINHEYLHYVLIMDHGYDVCIGLDKLVRDRQIEKKNWDYWLS